MIVLLQAFHCEKWSAIGRKNVKDAQTLTSLRNLGHHKHTFWKFLVSTMHYFRQKSNVQIEEQQDQNQILEVPNRFMDVNKSTNSQVEYFNSSEGQCLRLQIHPPHDCKIVGKRHCILCRGRRGSTIFRTTYACERCNVPLCCDIYNYQFDATEENDSYSRLTSCWALWHSGIRITPLGRFNKTEVEDSDEEKEGNKKRRKGA